MKILITGGTGSVGEVLIKEFSFKKEYDITFTYFSNEKLAIELSEKYLVKRLKITDYNTIVLDFDIIINNAGINITSDFTHEVELNDWNETLQTNLTIPFLICKKVLPYMIKKKWGRIINISSIYGLRSSEQNLPYNVSKHGLSGLTQTIAKEYAQYGITSNEICPAAIESNLMNRIATSSSNKEGISIENYFDMVKNEIPAKRMAYPRDVASLAYFLASEEAGFINGVSIPVDGGLIC